MDRRGFLRAMLIGGSGLFLNKAMACKKKSPVIVSRTLLPPQVNTFSSEIIMNSRLSYHDGYSGTLADQILSNVLWATAKAPVVGASRIIYVALPDNVYQYDPNLHEIFVHQPGNHLSEPNLAFEIGIASDLIEDSGGAGHYGHLAAISFWTSVNDQPCCCPKESGMSNANNTWNPSLSVHNVNSYGLMGTVSGVTDELVAISSDQSLPNPSTDGPVLLEDALNNLEYGDQFIDTELTLEQISQLAWASYGCNPHFVYNGCAGLVVASAGAHYYIKGRIYIVHSGGVERYHCRLPSGANNTRDHRIESVTAEDRRPQLRNAIPRLSQTAPDYFVYCASTATRRQLIEAGFCGGSALLQASSIDLQGHITAGFSSSERDAIINALSIPSGDLPLVIFSAGYADTGIGETKVNNIRYARATPNPFADNTAIKYGLPRPAYVRLAVYDSLGRRIKVLVDKKQFTGDFSVSWNGTDAHGKGVPSGTYFYVLECGHGVYKKKLVKT